MVISSAKKIDEAARWQAVAFGVAAGLLSFIAMSMPIVDYATEKAGLDFIFQIAPESYSLWNRLPEAAGFPWRWIGVVFPVWLLLTAAMYASDEAGMAEPRETFRALLSYAAALSVVGFVIVPLMVIFVNGNPDVTMMTAPYAFRGALMFLALFIVSVNGLQALSPRS